VRTGICKDYHQIRRSQFIFEIRGHLRKNLCLALIGFADILISGCHAVITAYYDYTQNNTPLSWLAFANLISNKKGNMIIQYFL